MWNACKVCGMPFDSPEFKKKFDPILLPTGIKIGETPRPTYFSPDKKYAFCGPEHAHEFYQVQGCKWWLT